ncbi:Alpha/Beta hydrolase protein [Phycomyces nitens]|nr:Alpha/Beta hydrolase protein [Phycomyces nitens]
MLALVHKSALARNAFPYVEIAQSMLAEFPLHHLAGYVLITTLTGFFGGFDYTLSWLTYYVLGLPVMLSWIVLFVEGLREEEVFSEAIKDFVTGGEPSEALKSPLSFPLVTRLINPAWMPPNVTIYPNITYATTEETAEIIETTGDFSQPKLLSLDIYGRTDRNIDEKRPVMIHIHGGAWRKGSKDMFKPHGKVLVEENNWIYVSIGYRLAPKNPYPAHLLDVKRAIRWVKQSIDKFGGDPNFIILSGDSAGGHLASMASLTANNPLYQPGKENTRFESFDTRVQGVICFSGALDIQQSVHHAEFFAHRVAMQKKGELDTEFLDKHNPTKLIGEAKQNGHLVPYLLITASRDTLVQNSVGKNFKAVYDKYSKPTSPATSECSLLNLPTAHHIYYVGWTPRSIHLSKLVQAWSEQRYTKKR